MYFISFLIYKILTILNNGDSASHISVAIKEPTCVSRLSKDCSSNAQYYLQSFQAKSVISSVTFSLINFLYNISEFRDAESSPTN